MPQGAVVEREAYSQYEFVNCFIAALIVGGKHEIWIRGTDRWIKERDCMHRLNRFLHLMVLRTGKADRDWRYFIVRLRNQTSPSPIGSFEGTLDLFRGKLLTWVSQTPPFYEYYKLEAGRVTAQWHLDHAPPLMRRMGEAAARWYLKEWNRR